MKKLVLETTAPFQGLPELVAYDEGLFAKEGLEIEWVDREQGVEKKLRTDITDPRQVDPFASHGKMLEQGKADMYNACEWGNYCRVQDTSKGSRQLGRRAIVAYSALVVAPNSPVYTPQQLANRTIGVPFYFGTHYIALHMLEGFVPRDMIKLCSAPNGSRYRLDALLKGEVDATTLTEPHVTLAEKKGCRIVCSAFFHGTEVASDRLDAEHLRGVQPRRMRGGAAHQRRQARLSALLHRLPRQEGSRDRGAEGRGPAGEPSCGVRSGADPARRDAAHVRLAQELGHAGGDRLPAPTRQHGRAALRAPSGGIAAPASSSGRRPNDHCRSCESRDTAGHFFCVAAISLASGAQSAVSASMNLVNSSGENSRVSIASISRRF